jgi:hypothetical protein
MKDSSENRDYDQAEALLIDKQGFSLFLAFPAEKHR